MVSLIGRDIPPTAPGECEPVDVLEPHYNIPYSVGPVPQATAAAWRDILASTSTPTPPNPTTTGIADNTVEVSPAGAGAGANAGANAGVDTVPLPPGVDTVPLPPLHFPASNPFIPAEFTLLSDEEIAQATPPTLLQTDARGGQLWHRLDTSFRQPRVLIKVTVISPHLIQAPATRSIMLELIHTMLEVNTYAAELAGVGFDVYATSRGIGIEVYGGSVLKATPCSRSINAIWA
jgi:hypothetical protein